MFGIFAVYKSLNIPWKPYLNSQTAFKFLFQLDLFFRKESFSVVQIKRQNLLGLTARKITTFCV